MEAKLLTELGEQVEALTQLFKPANFAVAAQFLLDALKEMKGDLTGMDKSGTSQAAVSKEVQGLCTEFGVLKKQLLEVLPASCPAVSA